MAGPRNNAAGPVSGLFALLILLPVLGGCATDGGSGSAKKDPAMARDAQYCRSLAGLDEAGRNDPLAYRAQAHYNKCMKDRGWPEN